MRKILTLIFLTFCLFLNGQNRNRKIVPYFKVRNENIGYNYTLPTNIGKELIAKSKDYEVSINNSTSGNFNISVFNEKEFGNEEKENELTKYFDSVKIGKHPELKNIEVVKSTINLEKNMFIVYGKKGKANFTWKTFVSEISKSGKYTLNTMIFIFLKTKVNRKIESKLIGEFGK